MLLGVTGIKPIIEIYTAGYLFNYFFHHFALKHGIPGNMA